MPESLENQDFRHFACSAGYAGARSTFAGVLLNEEIMFPVQIVPRNLEGFAESLEMHNLPFPQETQRGKHFGVIRHINKIFIGTAGFLLCRTRINTNSDTHIAQIYGIIYAKKRRKAKSKKNFAT